METNILDTLIEQTITTYREHEAVQKQKAIEQKKRAEQEAESDLQQLLAEVLTPAFLASVELTYKHAYDTYSKQHTVSALFPYMGYDWHIVHARGVWTIYIAQPGRGSVWSTKATGVSSAHLQARILIELGKHREEVKLAEEEYAERTRHEEAVRRKHSLAQAEAERERAERIRDADAIDARLSILVAEERRKAEQAMWHWPEGVTIEIYQVEYCRGSASCEESDEPSFDYDGGWTSTAHLDERGRIQLEPVKHYSCSESRSSARVVQLIPEIHRPVWTVHRVSETADLPEALREEVTVSPPHIALRQERALDGKSRFVEVEDLNYDDRWCIETVGVQPLPWIRALVEKASE